MGSGRTTTRRRCLMNMPTRKPEVEVSKRRKRAGLDAGLESDFNRAGLTNDFLRRRRHFGFALCGITKGGPRQNRAYSTPIRRSL